MTVTYTATQIIEMNEFAVYSTLTDPPTGDFTVENVELWVDVAANYIKARTNGNSFPHMDGTAGSKTITISDLQDAAFSPLMAAILRENRKTAFSSASNTSSSSNNTNSSNTSLALGGISKSEGNSLSAAISAGISATNAINNTANTIYRDMFELAILALQKVEYDWSQAFI
jgi:hypothetical protein